MRYFTAILAAAFIAAAPAMADTMSGSPKPSPSAMHSMKSNHMMGSPKPSPSAMHSMKSSMSGGHIMGSPKPSPSTKP